MDFETKLYLLGKYAAGGKGLIPLGLDAPEVSPIDRSMPDPSRGKPLAPASTPLFQPNLSPSQVRSAQQASGTKPYAGFKQVPSTSRAKAENNFGSFSANAGGEARINNSSISARPETPKEYTYGGTEARWKPGDKSKPQGNFQDRGRSGYQQKKSPDLTGIRG